MDQFTRNHIVPEQGDTVNIGTPTSKFDNVYANTFHGTFVSSGESILIVLPGSGMAISGNNPTLELLRGNVRLWGFRGTGGTPREGHLNTVFVKAPAALVQPGVRLSWVTADAAPTGDVVWNIDVTYAATAGTFPAPTSFSITSPVGTQYQEVLTPAQLLPTGLVAGTSLAFRVQRDQTHASDTFSGYALLNYLSVEYTT